MANGALSIAFMLQDRDDEVVREALACLVALMRNGHHKVQRALMTYFTGTREELFFEVVQARMRNSMDSIRELRTLRRQIKEVREKRSRVMGTLSMAGALGRQTKQAIDVAETNFQSSKTTLIDDHVCAFCCCICNAALRLTFLPVCLCFFHL